MNLPSHKFSAYVPLAHICTYCKHTTDVAKIKPNRINCRSNFCYRRQRTMPPLHRQKLAIQINTMCWCLVSSLARCIWGFALDTRYFIIDIETARCCWIGWWMRGEPLGKLSVFYWGYMRGNYVGGGHNCYNGETIASAAASSWYLVARVGCCKIEVFGERRALIKSWLINVHLLYFVWCVLVWCLRGIAQKRTDLL